MALYTSSLQGTFNDTDWTSIIKLFKCIGRLLNSQHKLLNVAEAPVKKGLKYIIYIVNYFICQPIAPTM
jgi:hypothetical protein